MDGLKQIQVVGGENYLVHYEYQQTRRRQSKGASLQHSRSSHPESIAILIKSSVFSIRS
jgi:hypothetical protein